MTEQLELFNPEETKNGFLQLVDEKVIFDNDKFILENILAYYWNKHKYNIPLHVLSELVPCSKYAKEFAVSKGWDYRKTNPAIAIATFPKPEIRLAACKHKQSKLIVVDI